jgi:hypothetical protein
MHSRAEYITDALGFSMIEQNDRFTWQIQNL